jgi:predicted HTH transcriptional regulator
MNYLILIIVAVAGVVLGAYFARSRNGGLISKQAEEKVENKEEILNFLRENEKVANNDIEKLLGVSDATATRYLDELEKEQKVRQIGTVGHAVYYVLPTGHR